MTVHFQTLLLVIMVTGLVMAISVGAVANWHQRDGMTYWAVGLALHAISYFFVTQTGTLGEFGSFLIYILCRACSWAVFAEGLYQFCHRPAPRALIWTPVVLTGVSFVLLFDQLVARIIGTSLIGAVQVLLSLLFMWQMRHETPGRGKYFVIVGLVIALTLLLLRAAGATQGDPAAIVSLTTSTPIQAVSGFAVLTILMLLSIGFVLMSKDRADNLNRLLATRDELTGLANRRRMRDVLTSEWSRAHRSGQTLALVMIDIDHFKNYNDQYGHQAGDVCLHQVAQSIAVCAARAGDLAVRYGGEEFLLILPDTEASAAQKLAQNLCQAVEALGLRHLNSPNGKVTVSVGVAVQSEQRYKDAESLLRAADEALYRAKHGGRNQVQVALASLLPGTLVSRSPLKLVQLIWRRAYESGNPLIDAQHQTLFIDANKLLGAAFDGQSSAEVENLVQVFVADIARHFQDEEEIINRAGYAGAAEHAQRHRVLLAGARDLLARFHGGSVGVGELFQYLVHEVVARHVLIADRDFFSSLSASLPKAERLPTET